MKKRLLVSLLSMLLVFSFIPTVVFATGEDGATEYVESSHVASVTAGETIKYYTTLSAAISAAESGNIVQLLSDVTLGSIIYIDKTVTLDLNGKTLTVSSYMINVYSNGDLTLKDSASGGKITGGTGSCAIQISAKCTMESGSITGNSTTTYGGVLVTGSTASFTMSGGTISNNSGSLSGGVYVYQGSFTMNGGTISGNKAISYSNAYGGGVYVSSSGSFTMNDGTISGNSAGMGGGVSNSGTFTMNGGSITGNTATLYGGGIYNSGTFSMTAGNITGNSSSSGLYGGGVYNGSSMAMTGGTISGNKANYGGGVYDSGTLTVSGASVITGNTKSDGTTANNVYLSSDTYITLGDVLSSSASIGVTTHNTPSDGSPVQVTTAETETTYYSNALSYFSSDNTNYFVRKNSSNGYLELCYIPTTLTTSDFIVDTNDETYTGFEITKTITDVSGFGLTLGTDYTVSYSDNVNAGTAIITITGTGNYTGTLTYTFSINPKTVSATLMGSTTKVYDGTTALPEDNNLSVILTGVVDADEDNVTVSAESIAYTDASVGTTKQLAVTGLSLEGSAASNYTLSSSGMNVGASEGVYVITAATPVVAITSEENLTYSGTAVSDPTYTVTLVNDETYSGMPTITWYSVADDGTETELDAAPSAVGSYKVVVTVSDAGDNYKEASASASITIQEAEQTVVVTGFTDVPYDGETHEVTVTADSDSTVTITYTDADGNTVTAPVNAGTYTVHVIVTKTGYTTVEQDVTVSIAQASQSISYDTTSVSKTVDDDAFTNELTQTTVYGSITYTSSDTSVATVDSDGTITIVGAGTTTISATVSGSDNYTSATATYTLTVIEEEEESTEEEDDNSSIVEEEDSSEDSDTGSTDADSSSDSSATDAVTVENVQSGDETNLLFWIAVMLLVASGLTVTVIYARRKYTGSKI